MWEFEVVVKETNEHKFMYGYSEKDLVRRYPNLLSDKYEIVYKEYVD